MGKAFAPVAAEACHTDLYRYAVAGQYPPSWANRSAFIDDGRETELASGIIFHLPTCIRVSGCFGIGLSKTLLVSEGGSEYLIEATCDLHLVAA